MKILPETTRILRTTLVASILLVSACSDDMALAPDTFEGPESQSHRITIVDDTTALSARMRLTDRDLQVVADSTPDSGPRGAAARAASEVRLSEVAELDAPEVAGVPLHATHVVIDGKTAYVGYNLQGIDARGAVDVLDRIDKSNPRLQSSALFSDSEVNALTFDKDVLYLATTIAEGAWEATAALEVAEIRKDGLAMEDASNREAVPSFAANGVAVVDNSVYVTSGDDGGLSVFDRKTLDLESSEPFADARSVTADDDRVVVLTGSPVTMRVYDADDGDLERIIELDGELVAQGKSGLDLAGDIAVVAMGRGGVTLVNVETGDVLDSIEFPDVDGVDPEDVVANEVAIYDDLVFVAAGGAGLRVLRASDDLDDLDEDDDPELAWVGRVEFGDASSVNFVARRKDLLFVAGGSIGLRVIRFRD